MKKSGTLTLSTEYRYGASGMREKKKVTKGGVSSTTQSLWAGSTLAAEKDSDDTLLSFAYGPGGLPLAVAVKRATGATETYSYHTDSSRT